MSEDNNLANSVCITEDEFEQFQAGTMYEEDEFITLSDIVPPQPDVPDLSTELSEIPYDNEVELSSSLNEDANHVNSTIDPSQNQSVELGIQSLDISGHHVTEEQGTSTCETKKLGKPAKANKNQKVGRRKKKANENDPSHQNDIQNDTYMDYQAIQDSGLSTTVGTNGNESKNETPEEQKYPRRTKRERIPNSSKYPTVYETALSETTSVGNTRVRRRGRPSKAPLNTSTISEPDSTNNDSTSLAQDELSNSGSIDTGNSSKTSEVRRGRRGRPKKVLPPHDALQSADHSSNNISETEHNMPLEDIKKTVNRRGRKKMSKTIETPLENTDTVPINNEDVTVELPKPCDTHVGDNSIPEEPFQETQAPHSDMMQGKTLHNADDMELENDDADDICLSKLKENIQNSNADSIPIEVENIQNVSNESNDTTTKRNVKMPIMADFEYNIDKIVKEASVENTPEQSLLVEDTTKRPNRRKAKQNFKYDEGSDEDPFANVELSDDDEPRNRKKGRYDDDDEYIPRKKKGMIPVSSESDSDLNEDFEDEKKQKRKRKLFDSLSPRKRGKNSKTDLLSVDECINEEIDKTSLTAKDEPLSMKPPAEAWATSNEFENFIAQKTQGTSLKIQKLSSKKNSEPAMAPIKIPVIDQNERKNKSVDISTQTVKTGTATTGSQTSAPYDIPMKTNITLSSEQSEKACKFLNSVVKTTVELGQLMKDKSESFMQKKINTDNVTDTFKMDYCVRKSFLLFKLAKHNLMQMEEDLAKQYDEFLKSNDLSACRENIKKVAPSAKAESDSDCEIVDVKQNAVNNQTEKPKFNPKTVFLNKELSIKIAKKPSADKNIDIKGRHTVWINDSVMVKKVKPTQSFLAQDSRNKKPPDYVTEKMVSDFFNNYHRQQVLAVCAPYLNTQWSGVHKEYACYYFVNSNGYECDTSNTDLTIAMMHNIDSTPNENYDITVSQETTDLNNPKSLSALCTEVVHCCMHKSVKEENQDMLCNLTDEKKEHQPLTLSQLCIQSLLSEPENKISTIQNTSNINVSKTVKSLKALSYHRLVGLISSKEINYDSDAIDNFQAIHENYEDNASAGLSEHLSEFEDFLSVKSDDHYATGSKLKIKGSYKLTRSSGSDKHVECLLSLCLKTILRSFEGANSAKNKDVETFQPFIHIEGIYPKSFQIISPMSLKVIACDRLKDLIYGKDNNSLEINHVNEFTEDFTINSVNTLSEEAFHRLEEPNEFQDEDDYEYEPDNDFEHNEQDNEENENEWASQVQMQELRSCNTPVTNSIQTEFANMNNDDDHQFQETHESIHDSLTLTARIKSEPLDDVPENVVDPSIVKTELVHGLDGMTIIPDSVVTKTEMIEHVGESVEREGTAYDVNTFEQFVRSNKMIRSMDDCDNDEQIFTQRGLRIKRQHEPDYDAENDMNMSLLVPHTFEPLHIESAKGDLMESSSDGEGKDSAAKKGSKKKPERKKKTQKKVKEIIKNKEIPPSNIKDVPSPVKDLPAPIKEKVPVFNEVAILTRRMREKIRQEEKKIESSDSETENIALSLRKDKSKKIETCVTDTNDIALSLRKDKNKKGAEKNKQKKIEQGESSKDKNAEDIEIQCNNVDSTEQILESKDKNEEDDKFMGFSTNPEEVSSYQNFLQSLYEKIIPEEDSLRDDVSDSNVDNMDHSRSNTPIINPDEPVELLECVPTMPIFDNNCKKSTKRPKKAVDKIKEKSEVHIPVIEKDPEFIERHGWHCYTVDKNDAKLYQGCHIPLEKLPESFVETYLEYHDITNRDNEDKEVDRLINLLTLNRANIKEGKSKRKRKGVISSDNDVSEQDSKNVSRAPSPANSDRLDELTPSEDEGANIEDELPPPVPVRSTDNCIAKNSLMDDNDSESDGGTKKIKQELIDTEPVDTNRKPGPKSRTKMKQGNVKPADVPAESLMLTADKVMNKELMLLHAPVILKEEVKETITKEPILGTKTKKKFSRTTSSRDRNKPEDDDSSSEEEKQWVCTKEKLLKRLGKKEDASVDDAKRAKIVDDFIVRRGDGPGKRHKRSSGRRSRKKILERLKQERFLSKELYGESTMDATPGGKRGANSGLFKGRRNIRKVIDKKSLQKSTVLANMEEFERKRRLNARQTQLRELLGFEEGVNVVVINDEVCLEYDFLEQRPVVTVHPFFTKVMKAHQYEGVKFMWDACFESLQSIESNRPGGGCILAHCMGLGKTLQVLALLHTVLTHPRAGMHRVLVCCPLSTVLNWVDEIHKWIGPVTDQIKVFELSKLKKTYERAYQLEDWYNGGGIFIIGYELFRSLTTLDPMIDDVRPKTINKIRTALLNPGPDIIICDEGHLLKNDCSVLAVAMSRVVTKRRIVLTGTPMQNNLREYYCMVNFVKPNLLGTYSEYSNRFENPIMNGQHRDSSEEDIKLMKARTHILHKVLEGCLQRQEASVLYPYLPKKHEYTVFIPLTKCQWDLYKHYVNHYSKESKQSVLKDFHILQKIWSHPQVLHNFQIKAREDLKKKEIKPEKLEDDLALEDKEEIKPAETEVWWLQYLADGAMLDSIDSSNKFVAVFRILHECVALGDKVLIFSTSLFCLDALEYFLKKINNWSLGHDYYRLDGSVPAEVRQKWCREFNAEINVKTKLFLISTRAGCLGLNMTAANRVIILDTSWNPAHDIQSIFRVYRFGQKKDCYIYRLVAMGTMEQKIYERSVTKQAVACRVVDEQQIDRHYNMAELTELYRLDEFGVGVAGGVAVGVSDVALLRVARDAAVHAVHEHDSLLRGSSEQQLPEHERAAAWMQFQQEHAHKQMQNDLESHNAAQALKKLHEQQEMIETARQQAQQLELAKQQAQVISIKTEDGPVHDTQSLLVARPDPPSLKHKKRGRKPNILKCRIPIQIDQPGPSAVSHDEEEDMVRQISNILVKHNFNQVGKGHKHIQDLVNKVKLMIQTNEPLNFENDELSASIASVLLRRKSSHNASVPPMPALTDISPDMPTKRRGRPRKVQCEPVSPVEGPQEAEETPEVVEELEVGGRRRRKAAIVAEQQFDLLDDGASQDSGPGDVIELDDDDWHQSDNESQPDILVEPSPAPQHKPTKRKIKQVAKPTPEDNSILLSDDDITETNPMITPKTLAHAPTEKPFILKPVKLEKIKEKIVPLHVSLLTNQNFIKIVAHTYLAGNPMLDEDAATLAAQYSTDKLLKESQSTGKPIEGGPIYDIAVKVLGIGVLKKLQLQDPVNKESTDSSSNMLQLLDTNSESAKKKIGPKSRTQLVNEEPSEVQKGMPKLGVRLAAGVVPVSLLHRAPPAQTSDPSRADDECILPDDEEVHCVPDTPPQPPLVIKLRMKPDQIQPKPPTLSVKSEFRITSGNVQSAPASAPPGKTYATISLDSDDEEPPAAPAPPPRPPVTVRALRAARQARLAAEAQKQASAAAGPVPVALTGPDSQRIPLNLGQPTGAPAPVPVSAASTPTSNPVPISLTGPDARPVPMSLTGPNLQPVPITLSRPGLRPIILTGENVRPVPMTLTGPNLQPIPMTLTGPNLQPIPMTLTMSNVQPVPMTLTMPNAQPVPISLSGPGFRAVPVAASTGASAAMYVSSTAQPVPPPASATQTAPPAAPDVTPSASQVHPNVYLYPASGERVLTRVPAAQLPPGLRPPQPARVQKVCKPGDILRLTRSGQLELVRSGPDVIHTIDDDEPAPTSPATRPPPQLAAPAQKPQPANPSPAAPPAADPHPVPSPTVPPKSGKPKAERRPRKISSSSSSGSDSSRSASPDPLSILKDVVHIQAPDRKKSQKQNAATSQPAPKPTTPTAPTAGKKLDAYTKKLSDFLAETKRKKQTANQSAPVKAAPAKTAPAKTAPAKAVPTKTAPAKAASKPTLTTSTNKPLMKSHTVKDSIDLTETVSQPSKSGGSTSASRGGKPVGAGKKDGPITVSGTSKNIVLDAKSKSLTNKSMVDLTGQKNIQVMNVKTIPSSSKLKPPEKRPAPPPDTTAKKKKTEPMTLKDFDIDDIDDIIELD